jgi:NDP-sugar pyrophosphorylase family protein
LRHEDFNSPVTRIMNPRPMVALVGTPREALRSIMEQNSVLHVPLVDQKGRVKGLETFRELLQSPQRDNLVFLMAGGLGTRLRPMTNDCPKPMLPVGGKPLLESILESFISAGFHRFCISVHYLAERIRAHFGEGQRWGVDIQYVEETNPLGTGGALGLLPDTGKQPVLMMNSDVLTRVDFNSLLGFHSDHQAALTLCVREYDLQVPFGVVEGEGSMVSAIVEKPSHRFFVNAGIYVISPEVVDLCRPPRRLDMPDLVQALLADKRRVAMFPIHEYWLDVGRLEDFERAQTDVASF